MTRIDTVHELHNLVEDLGDDELRVLLVIAERLKMGARQYGALKLASDPRDFVKEGSEEALDLAVYLSMGLVQRRSA